ncbi:MAG TPA: hypothetical protein VK698_03595 [Kofleriaceae bacterium]|nr:hypothetical protein [Kofleriaceae bacterium]
MSARDATAALRGAPVVAALLWIAWLAPTTPIAGVLLEAPSSFLLRSLPVPRWHFWAVQGAQLLVLELPWAVLWGRGEGIASGMHAAVAAAGVHAMVIARPRTAVDLAASIALVASVGAPLPGPAALALALPAALLAVAIAWTRAPGRDAWARAVRVGGRPAVALARAYLVSLARGEAAALWRGLLIAAAGGGATALAARANQIAAAGALSLGISGAFLVVATGGLAASIARADRQQSWLLAATGTGPGTRMVAAAGAAAIGGALLGVVHAAAVIAIAAPSAGAAVRLLAGSIPWGAAVAALVQEVHVAAARAPDRATGWAVAGTIGVVMVATIGAATLGELAIPVLVVAGAVGLGVAAEGEPTGEP